MISSLLVRSHRALTCRGSGASTYYFNKNMSTFVDYKINQIDDKNKLGVSSDDIVALGMTYQF